MKRNSRCCKYRPGRSRPWRASPGSPAAARPIPDSSLFPCNRSPSARSRPRRSSARLRPKLAQVPGARLFLRPVQDIRVGGRQSNSHLSVHFAGRRQLDDSTNGRRSLTEAMQQLAGADGCQFRSAAEGPGDRSAIDRDTATRLGVTPSAIDNTLYDAFGQRQVSMIYNPLNQYHVVMEVAPRYWQNPETLKDIWVSTSGASPSGRKAPTQRRAPLRVRRRRPDCLEHGERRRQQFGAQSRDQCDRHHRPWQRFCRRFGQHRRRDDGAARGLQPLRPRQYAARGQSSGQFVASTISFNLAPGKSLSDAATGDPPGDGATSACRRSIHGSFAGHGGELSSTRCRPSRC